MIVTELDEEKCTGCHACYSVCPVSCIAMREDEEGFLYPYVESKKCINCGRCGNVCPSLKMTECEREAPESIYAAKNLDNQVRRKSSSGGIFSLVAKYILKNGGVVFGASMSEDYKYVVHIMVESESELGKLRGSKYVQSKIGDCYFKAKQQLMAGRIVLFTGTPCQIAGLRSYLGKNYEKLYTQDVICHGVPSPKIWRNYVNRKEETFKSQVTNISFRYKEHGWNNNSLIFEFLNGTKYIKKQSEDPYMVGYLTNIYLRPSCYQCMYKNYERESDITLADFWGIEKIMPEMDDGIGTSLIMINTEKGKKLFQGIQSEIIYKETTVNPAISVYNPSCIKAAKKTWKRKVAMNKIKKGNIEQFLNFHLKYITFIAQLKKRAAILKKMAKKLR